MIQGNGKISHALGLEEGVLLNWPYYPKQSTDLMQSLSKYPWHFFHITRTSKPKIYVEPQKTPELPKQSWGKRTKLGGITLPDFRL